jgi:hypothetical protein
MATTDDDGPLVDELHVHRSRGVIDVLDTATGARRRPLVFESQPMACECCGEPAGEGNALCPACRASR